MPKVRIQTPDQDVASLPVRGLRECRLTMSNDHRKDGTFRVGNRARQEGDRPAEGQLQMRVALNRKGRWVQVARAQGMSLSEWVGQTLDAACNAPASTPQTPCTPPE